MTTLKLYVNGRLADLDDTVSLSFTESFGDLTNPTAVKNGFSKTVTLKGTAANDAIFDRYFDWQHRAAGMSASQRVPFELYCGSTLFTSGYLKLSSIGRTATAHTYDVTLYGGVGEFVYGLSDKYLEDLTMPFSNLRHTISRDFVCDDWEYIYTDDDTASLHQLVGYVPMYNGTYDDFTGDKVQVSDSIADSSVIDLGQDLDEWNLLTFRSYKQRPAVKVSAIIKRILDESGYTYTIDPLFANNANPYWSRLFVTMPLLSDKNRDESGTKTLAASDTDAVTWTTATNAGTVTETPAQIAVNFTNPSDGGLKPLLWNGTGYDFTNLQGRTKFKFSCTLLPLTVTANLPSNFADGRLDIGDYDFRLGTGNRLSWKIVVRDLDTGGTYDTGARIVVTGSTETPSGKEATVKVPGPWTMTACTSTTATFGWTGAVISTEGDVYILPTMFGDGGGNCQFAIVPDTSSLHGYNWVPEFGYSPKGSSVFTPLSYSSMTFAFEGQWLEMDWNNTVRSDTTLVFSDIVKHGVKQSDFLLSWCKLFGMVIVKDKYDRHVDLLTRNAFFSAYGVEDWTGRLDTSQQSTIVPVTFTSKYLAFDYKESDNAYLNVYKDNYGRNYGSKTLDTGYEFNTDTANLIDNTVFSNGLCSTEHIWTFSLGSDGRTFASAMVYDPVPRPCSFTFDGHVRKPSTSDFQLFFRLPPVRTGSDVTITDDTEEQVLADEYLHVWPSAGTSAYCRSTYSLPRYWDVIPNGTTGFQRAASVHFAKPAKSYSGLTDSDYSDSDCVYSRFWAKYVADLYDSNAETVTMRFNLSPADVMSASFRDFVLVGGTLYHVNKIDGYDLVGTSSTKVELVRVGSAENYACGQDI